MRANFEKGTKICSKCRKELPLDSFYKNKKTFDGYEYQCKDCKPLYNSKEASKRYRESHKEEIKEYNKNKYLKNKNEIRERNKNYEQSERGKEVRYLIRKRRHVKILEYNKKYYQSINGKIVLKKIQQKRRVKCNKYIQEKRKIDKIFALKHNLRSRIHQAITKGWKSGHTLELLGCTIEELKQHLELQFEPGMSWDNYGEWHIDHIIPCSYFDLTKEENQRICFNYRNLQPLWASENDSKGAKVPDDVEELVEFLKKEIYGSN
jgi:hypothetical protein|nr:MAG TPA: restriction endonuclease [Bacteriophage sp.]